MVAVHVCGDAIARDTEFAGETHALMTPGASVARKILLGHRRIGVVMSLDGMNAVAIGADRRESVTPRYRLSMNALIEGLRDLCMALAAGGGDVEFGDWRLGVVRGADRVRAMSVSTYGSLGGTFFGGTTVYAVLV